MKIVIEANIPYIRGIFEPFAEVAYLKADEINSDAVKDADALIVRTRTRCNEKLLKGSRCKFIGTATIGTDHIDLDWCKNNGIHIVNAPGCNAPAVAQYVLSTVGHWMQHNSINDPSTLTLGIVGVGHVGSIIKNWAKAIGFELLLCDPPRADKGETGFVDIDTIAKNADIITFHTPFTKDGEYATFHLCDKHLIDSMQHCKLLINCARGGIVDSTSLIDAMKCGSIQDIAIDCWEGEPNINPYLLENAFIATPHIAGYSKEGKQRATDMMIDSMSRFFKLPIKLLPVDMGNNGTPSLDNVMKSYDISVDTDTLKSHPTDFEALRNNYNLRAEV